MKRRNIINRYLTKEILATFIAVSVVLLLIFVSGQLVGLFSKAASGNLQVGSILAALGLKSIANLVFVLPLSFYIAILLAFSRMYKDNEMIVLSACGISHWRILSMVLMLASLFAIGVGWLSLQLAPWAESKTELLTKQHQQQADVENLTSGRFKELSKGEGVVYVQEFDQDALQMKQIFMQYQGVDSNSVISAETGFREESQVTGDRFLILENGTRYEGEYASGQVAIINFKRHGVRLEQKPLEKVQFRKKAVPTAELIRRSNPDDHAELQWRISTMLIVIVLAILAVPLSRTSPRQGRYSKLALALLIYIIYTNLLNVSRAWLNKDEISVWLGMWWVHVLLLVFALTLYVQWKPLLRRWRGN